MPTVYDEIAEQLAKLQSIPGVQAGNDGNTEYFIFGVKPQLLVVSGLHGDETESVPFLCETIVKYYEVLPPLLFIPTMSPSATFLGKRTNAEEHDMNRMFSQPWLSEEVRSVMRIVTKNSPYRMVLSFHEDPEFAETYMYDGTYTPRDSKIISWQEHMRRLGIGLYTGIDDENDDTLTLEIKDGYFAFNPEDDLFPSMFEDWTSNARLAPRNITIEVPGQGTSEQKQAVVESSLLVLAQ